MVREREVADRTRRVRRVVVYIAGVGMLNLGNG